MRGTSLLLACLAILVNSAEIRIGHPSGLCEGEIDRVWLDVVFLVDSSSGMTQHGLRKAEAFIQSAMRQMTIGEAVFQQSRVGIITYAAEAHEVRDLSRTDNTVSYLPYAGDDQANLLGAFTAALNMFANSTAIHRKKAIVIAASTYEVEGPNNAVQIAEQFKIAGGSIITIDYRITDTGLSPLASLASHGFAFTNDDLEVGNLYNSLLHVNCFCPYNERGASSSTYGSPDGKCVDDENFQADWSTAAEHCTLDGGYIVKIDSVQKQQAMDALTSSPYWIGLRYSEQRGGYYWQDWTPMVFARWAPTQPDIATGECTFIHDSLWYSAPCDGDRKGLADHVYFCENQPCSANINCYDPVTPFVTLLPHPETDKPKSTIQPVHPTEGSTAKHVHVSTTIEPEHPIDVSTLNPEHPGDASTIEPELPIGVSTLNPEHRGDASTIEPELPIGVSTLNPEHRGDASTIEPELPIGVSTLNPEHRGDASTIEHEHPIDVSTLNPEHRGDASTIEHEHPIDVSTLNPEHPGDASTIEPASMMTTSTAKPIKASTVTPNQPTKPSTSKPPHSRSFYPNGTSVELNWWQSTSSHPIFFTGLVALDTNGEETYPIRLNAPFTFKISLKNPYYNHFSHAFFRRHYCRPLEQTQYLVLDEADRMLVMGFAEEVMEIMEKGGIAGKEDLVENGEFVQEEIPKEITD